MTSSATPPLATILAFSKRLHPSTGDKDGYFPDEYTGQVWDSFAGKSTLDVFVGPTEGHPDDILCAEFSVEKLPGVGCLVPTVVLENDMDGCQITLYKGRLGFMLRPHKDRPITIEQGVAEDGTLCYLILPFKTPSSTTTLNDVKNDPPINALPTCA